MKQKIFFSCSALALMLCFAQVQGSKLLILSCLMLFLALIAVSAGKKYELPVLLFFLPWTELLKIAPGNISFYTLALLLVGMIQVFRQKFQFQNYYVGITLVLILSTLLAKILSGYKIDNSYLMLMAMLVLYPLIDFWENRYDFSHLCLFFSAGIIIAALTAQELAAYPNIGQYIRVDSYLNITRRCGYYRDPNFYVAQITAALAGNMVLLTTGRKSSDSWLLMLLSALLVYCGFLSGSKSFALIFAALLLLWCAEILISWEIPTRKVVLLGSLTVFLIYIFTSHLFRDKIHVILTRFSWANNISSFTTGRTELWGRYLREIFNHMQLLFLGQGFTDVIIGPRASHNTLIQLVYQFGVFGAGLLLAWFGGLYRDITGSGHLTAAKSIRFMILMMGALMPWMAIDALFFNELFLIPSYVFIGIRELCKD